MNNIYVVDAMNAEGNQKKLGLFTDFLEAVSQLGIRKKELLEEEYFTARILVFKEDKENEKEMENKEEEVESCFRMLGMFFYSYNAEVDGFRQLKGSVDQF